MPFGGQPYGPMPQQQQQPPQNPKLNPFARLGGAVAQIFGGLNHPGLSDQQNRDALRPALMQAGLATIAGSMGQGAEPPSFLNAFVSGAVAGQQAGARVRGDMLADTRRLQLEDMFGDASQPMDRQQLMTLFQQLMAAGEVEMARAVSDFWVATRPDKTDSVNLITVKNGRETHLVNPNTGETVRTLTEVAGTELDSLDVGNRVIWFPKGQPDKIVHTQWKTVSPDGAASRDAALTQQQIANGMALQTQYFNQTRIPSEVASAVSAANAALDTAIGDQALIVAFNKLIDPGSIVREGEFARVARAGGFTAEAQAYANRFLKEGRLPANVRKQLQQQVTSLANTYYAGFLPTYNQFKQRAADLGLNVDLYVPDYFRDIGIKDPFGDLGKGGK